MLELINKEETARRLGVSPYSIPRLIRDGLSFVRVGRRRIMFDPADVAAYISLKKNQEAPWKTERKK
jgi:predicted DNA-binding transcriptional regulator AlpA